jgi:Zn-dependent protease
VLPERIYYVPAGRGLRFGPEELRHIAFAIAAMTAAFTLAFAGGLQFIAYWPLRDLALLAAASFVAVITGFLLHEIAHKVMGQRYGCWAEFRSSTQGLLIALLTAAFGFLFAAPGAVYIAGRVNKAQNGRISLAGPMTNVAVSLPFMAGAILLGLDFAHFDFNLAYLMFIVARINLFLAIFNMIPFPPLDGSKVIRWSVGVWAGALALMVALFALPMVYLGWPLF